MEEDNSIDTEHIEIEHIPMQRRGFLGRFCAGVAGAMACSIEAQGGDEVNEDKEKAEESPEELLSALEEISADYCQMCAIEDFELQDKLKTYISKYIATIEARGGILDLSEIDRAHEISGNIIQHTTSIASGTPVNSSNYNYLFTNIDLIMRLIESAKHIADSIGTKTSKLDKIMRSLRESLLLHDSFRCSPRIWDYSADKYIEESFPAEGAIDLALYAEELEKLPAGNAIANRVVARTYRKAFHGTAKQEGDEAKKADELTPEKLLKSCRKICTALYGYFNSKRGKNAKLTEQEVNDFLDFSDEELLPFIQKLMLTDCTAEERKDIGVALADSVCIAGEAGALVRHIQALGGTPEDVICSHPLPSKADPEPYDLEACTSTLLNVYRATMGSIGIADSYSDSKELDPIMERGNFRKNAPSIFLWALSDLYKYENDIDSRALEHMKILVFKGMKFDSQQYEKALPLEIWGERSGLFLSVSDIGNSGNTFKGDKVFYPWEEKTFARDLNRMAVVMQKGYQAQYPNRNVPSVFTRRDASLLRDAKILRGIQSPHERGDRSSSSIFQKSRCTERRGFATALRQAMDQRISSKCNRALRAFGFSDDETCSAK